MELTKIPIATALYYAAKSFWKVVFFFALVAVNFSTFETIIQGFELAFNQRSKVVKIERKVLDALQKEKNVLEEEMSFEGNIDIEINEIQKQITQLENRIIAINTDANNEIAELQKQNEGANPRIDLLSKQIDSNEQRLQSLEESKRQAVLSLQSIKEGLFNKQKEKREAINTQIASYDSEIKDVKNLLAKNRSELDKLAGNAGASIEPKINAVKDNARLKINNIQRQINQITSDQLSTKQSSKTKLTLKQDEFNEKLIVIEEKINAQKEKVNDIASENQIYRLAVMIKVGPGQWFMDQKVDGEISEADLTQEDIDTAFWLWFGFLAFVISIIGTLVAFAGLHLMDERMHEIRNKPIGKNTIRYRFSKLLVLMVQFLNTSIKTKLKPITVEKIVEKEVKVEVEKPVYEEKIVYQKIEVPKEVVKREIVHVPLWTQDPDLLSKKFDPSESSTTSPKKKK
jgi:predicted  nucleic acid-binding Zn-ribbon protein